MNERTHLSIGEVLSLLQQDFPDVTISKIRFLESQGLLDPERTPSGYRKFYDSDIERLRWILRQQRENFLPLKVIKDRLAAGEVDFSEDLPAGSDGSGAPAAPDGDGAARAPVAAAPPPPPPPPPAAPPATPVPPAPPAPPPHEETAAALLQEAPTPRSGRATRTTKSTAAASASSATTAPILDTGDTAVNMTAEELIAATGLSAREIGDLERFGMLASRTLGTTTYYDEDALVVARLAAAFRSHGIEARHLRMYKVAAEREAGRFEQLVVPVLHKRGPQARQEAIDLLNELASLGDGLRAAMLRQLLRDYLGR